MLCPSCGFDNPEGMKFCGECGAPLKNRCPNCGFENPPRFKFCGECAAPLTGRPPVSSPQPLSSTPQAPLSYTPPHLAERIRAEKTAMEARGTADGERKTITALFADIQGSMALIEDLDPEEARRLIDPALQLMMEAVHRYQGYVAQSTGDGVFALFGAPIAHEDHPQRALYAALRMREESRKYAERLRFEKGVNLEIRVGVNTGEVVVRSIRKDDLHTDYVPIGHSTSLAARMEGLATGGSIVVSEPTHRLTEGYFQFKELGAAKIKGVSEPVPIYELLGVGPLRTRLQVAAWRGLVKFVGRQAELEQMKRALELAKGGHGQVVAVMGEPGVGKSRLVYEFKLLSQRGCRVLETFSISHGKAYPYLPLIELLKNYFEIAPSDDERRKRERVTGKVLTLDRTLEETLPYLSALLGEGEGLRALKKLLLEKTEGNPFFLEEVVQSLAEEGVLAGERGSYRLEKAPTAIQISPTVQGVLASRIDRLGVEEKRLLQTLSVIGKEFSLSLLQEVIHQPEEVGATHALPLQGLLSRLQGGEFIYEQLAFPEIEYTFKHALTQEVAYNSVLLERRKGLHERTAQALEKLYRHGLEDHYSELAHHYGRSGNAGKAVEYLGLAGRQAVERSAYGEAIHQLTTALELIKLLPDAPERIRQELFLQTTLGPALMVTQGYGAPEVEQAYRRAGELCRQVGEAPQLFPVLWGLGAFHEVRGEYRAAHELAEQFLGLAQEAQDSALLIGAHWQLGAPLLWLGELAPAREHFERGIALYNPQQHSSLISFYGINPGVGCLTYAAWALWFLGHPDQALKRVQEAITLAQEVSHPYSLSHALTCAAWLHACRREAPAAQERAAAGIALAAEQGFSLYLSFGTIPQGWALAEQGDVEEGISQMRQGLAACRTTGAMFIETWILALLSDSYGKAGQIEEGLTVLAEALDFVQKTGERFYEAELHRLRGELLLKSTSQGPASRDERFFEAETSFHQALDIARRQSAKSLELRATMSLSRLWQGQGKREEARQRLAEVYGWFTEGFDTADLKEAKALLEELEGMPPQGQGTKRMAH
ncbi:MAG: AAA family ATPase [Betaproteobacteria bacterium]|nr:AAA family ATPase [Betaproteobacteria bacterium]